MLNSQGFRDKNGILETVRVAAYFPKRLTKKLVDQTNIPASVDIILQEQEPSPTHRVLGYLLLGVVRILSRKVQYVCDNCEYLKVELNTCVDRKRANTSDEPMHAPYLSITLPTTFQLDAFDLQISEERTSAHIRPSEDLVLKDAHKQTCLEYGALNKNYLFEYGSNFQSSSTILTPFDEENGRVESTEKLKENNSFSLDEFLDSVIPGLVEQEPQRHDEEGMRVSNHEAFVEVKEASTVPARDEGEALDTIDQIIEMVSPHDGASTTIDATPKSKGPNASGTRTPAFMETPVADNVASVGVEEELSAAVSHNEDQDTDTSEKIMLSEMVWSKNTNNNQASVNVVATPKPKWLNASGNVTSAFTPVQTPATMDSCRVSRKRNRCLIDDIIILPNRVIKESISNASHLLRLRKVVPHNRLQVWKIQKLSNLPRALFEPPIPYSSKIGSVISIEKLYKIQVAEATTAPEKMNPIIHLSPEQILNIPESPMINQSPDQVDIAPSTPISNPTSSKLHDGCRRSIYFDSVEEHDDYSETDNGLINEDIDSPKGHGWEMEKWSAQTRAAAISFCKNLSSWRKQKEDEVANLFQILKGKNKSESARMFYEILVLKSGGYVDVKQQAPYDDIVIVGTIKLKKFRDY